MNFNKNKHAFMEALPLSHEHVNLAPQFFKEAIFSSSLDESPHRPLISTSQKGIRSTMIDRLPYFHVYFDISGGLGHIIDSPDWSSRFVYDVVAGMLDLDGWRNPKALSKDQVKIRDDKFKAIFADFDWTRALE